MANGESNYEAPEILSVKQLDGKMTATRPSRGSGRQKPWGRG